MSVLDQSMNIFDVDPIELPSETIYEQLHASLCRSSTLQLQTNLMHIEYSFQLDCEHNNIVQPLDPIPADMRHRLE